MANRVRALSSAFPAEEIADADALVMLTSPDPSGILQFEPLAPKARKILWLHHAPDQPAVQMLADPAVVAVWDEFVFISEWQRREYLKHFPAMNARPNVILRNAISPVFENLFGELPILACKSPAPSLAYSSTPFRGLNRLLLGWPKILAAHPGAKLGIFSGMKLYDGEDPEPIANMLAEARRMPGVVHVGPVPQPDLAEALRGSLVLAYPNSFPETACIAVMEAIAAGCIVVTSDLGALPETLAGHGILLPFEKDADTHAEHFADEVIRQISVLKQEWATGELESRLADQIQWANETYSWRTRALEWENWLNRSRS